MQADWPDWIRTDINRMVSVDVEASGPNPADYALLSIGACTLNSPREEFYVEIQPTTMNSEAQSQEIHQLDLEKLSQTGQPPEVAMRLFADWIAESISSGISPLFIGFNAPFDWMFVCDYFHRFMGINPFGHSALDIKSFLMGFKYLEWEDTSMARLTTTVLRHNALEDACDQADLFRRIVTGSE
ncbi:MAG: 3'-5' exonuclease [Pelolinea sp.]|nr:3'-5' exonuclease [Pelolinea sp.]